MYSRELEVAVDAVSSASRLCMEVRGAFAADGVLDKADKSPVTVTDVDGKALDFSLGRSLCANRGVIATNGPIHDRVLAAVAAVVKP